MRDDDADKRPVPGPAHVVGQDLARLSVHELEARIALLGHEIRRLEEAKAAKLASRSAADAFFKAG